MCKLPSGLEQRPFAVQSPKCAPQPSFEASVNSWRACVVRGVKVDLTEPCLGPTTTSGEHGETLAGE